jgi:predicted deacylase
MYRTTVKPDAQVERGDIVGYITEASDGTRYEIRSDNTGVIIGRLELPMVHEGDAILHLARFEGDVSDIANHVGNFQQDYAEDKGDLVMS